jgi:subtilisin family serine protease
MAGIAPECRLLSVRIFNDWGASSEGLAAAAVTWAVDHGARVINASWGTILPGEAGKMAFEDAIARGVVLVAAMGNSGTGAPIAYPAATTGAIAVAASNDRDGWPSFSSVGEHVSVAAPGEGILSTYPVALGNGFRVMSGTSMAAPHVSGLVGIMLAREPKLTPAMVKDRIERTALDTVLTGRDSYSGAGRIDAPGALGLR